MIYLVTGVPGSGKSLRVVKMILDFLKPTDDFPNGRKVYSDIAGLNIEGVLKSPDDWRDTPEGSVVVYDEAQDKKTFESWIDEKTKKEFKNLEVNVYGSSGMAGPSPYEQVRAMEKHRHTGHDLIFITQAPTFVHHHIRKLVGKHIHCYRALGLQGCTVYTWDGICDNPNGFHEKKTADTERWTYPKELFKYYKSSTVHTHKFKIPKKLIFIGIAIVSIALVTFFMLSNSSLPRIIGITESVPLTTTATDSAGLTASGQFNNPTLQAVEDAKPVTVSIMGCVSGRFCRCFGQDGNILDLKETMCRDLANGNLALPIKIPQNDKKTNSSNGTPKS